jgi:AcrR family transcriptional regulator|tara:strand:- start:394 stop:996 length:603 start_codon:yes stop_codon:yes gene_type:complete
MSKRDDILCTALRLFNERGYQAVGVDTIRDEANVSKMTLYNHFKNKDRLVEEVLKLRHRQFKESLESSLDSIVDAKEKLREVFDWHTRWFFSPDFFGCMFIRATGEYQDANGMVLISQDHKQWVARLLEDILSEIDVEEPASVARFFQLTLDGMIINASIFNTFDRIDEVWQILCRYVGLPCESLQIPVRQLSDKSFSSR